MEIRNKLLWLLIHVFFFILCRKEGPIAIQPKEHACKYCQMQIVDLRFNAQLFTPKGKIHHFDSIECLLAYHLTHHPKNQSDQDFKLYVKDFFNKERYIKAEKALYIQSDLLSSPMSANLSSYQNQDSLNLALEKYKGKALDFKQTHEYILNVWLKRY